MWLTFDSLVNARDVGGTPTADGQAIRSGVLLRSDNLQELTESDLARLHDLGITDIIDLRSNVEVSTEGPTPADADDGFTVHHLSLFIEPPGEAPETSASPETAPEPVETEDREEHVGEQALPWIGLQSPIVAEEEVAGHYLSYLADRPDSVVAALRIIADAPGATLVHCAAGKDRTGTIVALALLIAGAEELAVVEDYARSSERMREIVDRLLARPIYHKALSERPFESNLTRPEIMQAVVNYANQEYGGVLPMLTEIGWTEDDTERMRKKLLA